MFWRLVCLGSPQYAAAVNASILVSFGGSPAKDTGFFLRLRSRCFPSQQCYAVCSIQMHVVLAKRFQFYDTTYVWLKTHRIRLVRKFLVL